MNSMQKLYDFSEFCDDDLIVVSCFIQMMVSAPSKNLLCDVEKMNVNKFDKELDVLLDLKIGTIRDLVAVFRVKSIEYNINQEVKRITRTTTLIDLMDCEE